MALFKILQGPDVRLHGDGVDIPAKDLHEGYCYFTTDNNLFYVDYKKMIDGVQTLVRSPLNAHSSYFLYKSDGTGAYLTDKLNTGAGNEIEIPTCKAIYDYFLDENTGIMHLKMDKADPRGTGSFGLNLDASTVLGKNAVALNTENAPTAENAFAAGLGTIADNPNQFVIGKYNNADDPTLTDGNKSIFIIGSGTDKDNRENAFNITWDGNANLKGTLTLADPMKSTDAMTKGFGEKLVEQTIKLTIIREV